MKKTLLLASLITLCAGSLWADQLGPDQHWIERGEGEVGFPASSDTYAPVGVGFGGAIGYRLSEHFSISVASGYYQYNMGAVPGATSGGTFSYVPLDAVFSHNFGDGDFRPYVSFGIGLAFNTYAVNVPAGQANTYETSFFMSPAIGFFEVLSPQAAFFLEGRADMDYRNNGALGMGNGSPSVFIPVQAGIAFFVI